MNKCKRSGYYWIKNECNDQALRVYCDYKTGRGQYYAFYGKFKDLDPDIAGANSYEGIHKQCSKLGLYPVEIQTEA